MLERLGLWRAGEDGPVAPETLQLDDDGVVPNSPLPVLLYRGEPAPGDAAAATFEHLFTAHRWPAQWRGGVFPFHHYHSRAHEALGVGAGWARIQLGGEHGPTVEVSAGDAIVLPAGTGHCRIKEEDEFTVVGAYPANQPEWDLLRADPREHDAAVERIARVPQPEADPVDGADGPLGRLWTTQPEPVR
ncbi:MAG: hypothetical protein WD138_06410 [Halofilum sp. (in: g-proteobacteria)]